MMKQILTFSAIALCSVNTHANLSEQLSQRLSAQACLSANFEQQLRAVDGTIQQRSSGTVQAARPAKLRWQIVSPDHQLMVSDGETLWRYEADLEQLLVSAFDSDSAGLPARLMSGDPTAIEAYTIQLQGDVYQLAPKQASDLVQFLSLQFNDTGLAAVSMTDSFDQITDIRLTNTDADCASDGLYSFEAPAGIDVIYE